MTSKNIGHGLLAVGFLAGAFFTVRGVPLPEGLPPEEAKKVAVESVSWPLYCLAAGAMVVGLVMVRAARKRHTEDSQAIEDNLEALDSSLSNVRERLGRMISDQDIVDVYAVHGWVDEELIDDLATFVEHRESLIHKFDLHTYAEIMSAFAGGERLINRSWSASADGYVDEVWASLKGAEREMLRAGELLAAARG